MNAETAVTRALAVPALKLPVAIRASLAADIIDKLAQLGFLVVPRTSVLRPRRDPNRCPEHLTWVRQHPCAVRGCTRRPQAAHVRMGGTGGGIGKKPPDRWTVPLCARHHAEQHAIGHRAFDDRYALDLRKMAEDLAAQSPYLNQPEEPEP